VPSVLRRASLAAALVGMLAASAQVAGAQTTPTFDKARFAPQDVAIQRLTTGIHMTKDDTAPTRGFAGPTSMAANPEDPRIVVAATANLRTRTCQLLVSTDAGVTWSFSRQVPAPPTYPSCTNNTAGVAQSSLGWGRDGTLYYAMEAYGEGEGTREGKTSIALARTTDLGETWTTTLVNDARAQADPKPENTGVTALAVDTSGEEDAIYVGYNQDWAATAPDGHPLEDKDVVAVSASTDGGATFGPPVNLNDFSTLTTMIGGQSYPLHFQTAFGRPFLTAHDGVILAVGDSGPPSDNPPPEDVYEGIFGEADPMIVARSTDQGRTWTVSELSPPVFTSAGSHSGMGWTPQGGENGTFVLAYAATPGDTPSAGRTTVVVQRSTDLGTTWSEPLAITDDDPSRNFTSFYPQLDVAPNGRVDVVWQDNREQTDYLFNVRYTYSTDGGATWAPNVAVQDQPVDFSFGISFNSDIRQPPGVASTDHYAAIGWADPRFASPETQTQDNFGVIAQFSPLPARTNTALYVAVAIVSGLVLAGVVLLVTLLLRRRTQAPAASSA
jgi:hypothetical protein